ncbi:putative protein TPRXL [Sparus aurata]|uniref:putative protein TPRXL n=1 Tax=Sparus aurata TaxID=8175 RepID=UPI0011C128C6|nr:putative protein TPRXL [Sparus aurata]
MRRAWREREAFPAASAASRIPPSPACPSAPRTSAACWPAALRRAGPRPRATNLNRTPSNVTLNNNTNTQQGNRPRQPAEGSTSSSNPTSSSSSSDVILSPSSGTTSTSPPAPPPPPPGRAQQRECPSGSPEEGLKPGDRRRSAPCPRTRSPLARSGRASCDLTATRQDQEALRVEPAAAFSLLSQSQVI